MRLRGISRLAAALPLAVALAVPGSGAAGVGVGCAAGNAALTAVTAGQVAVGDRDWYDASSTGPQYIRAQTVGDLDRHVDVEVYAWDGATTCTLLQFNPCTWGCVDIPAMGPFPPGSYLLSVIGSFSSDSSPVGYVVTSLPADPHDV